MPQSELKPKDCPVKQIWVENGLLVAVLDDDSFYYFYPNMSLSRMHLGSSNISWEDSINARNMRDIEFLFSGAILGILLRAIIGFLPPAKKLIYEKIDHTFKK